MRRYAYLVMFLLGAAFASPMAYAFTEAQATSMARTRFQAALEHGSRFAAACLALRFDCQLTPREDTILASIWRELLDVVKLPTLEFHSESAEPGFFQLDGAVRIAKTGDFPTDVVYVNLDMIALTDATGFRPLTLGEAMVVVMHELGHHHDRQVSPRATHEELDVMGNKIRRLMQQNADVQTLSPSQWPALKPGETVSLEHFVAPGAEGQGNDYSFLFVTGPFGVVDLSHKVVESVTCPRSYYRGELDFEGKPYWSYLRRAEFVFTAPTTAGIKILGRIEDASVRCRNYVATSSNPIQTFTGYRNGIFNAPLLVDVSGAVRIDWPNLSFSMASPPDEWWQ